MAVLSYRLWMEHKRTTEDDMLPGSDHPQCPDIWIILHAHAGHIDAGACDFGLRGLGLIRMLVACHGMGLCHWARHFTCMCTLSTLEWMNGHLAGQGLFVCLKSFQCCNGSRSCMLPCGSWARTGTNRSYNQGKVVKTTNVQPLAAKFSSSLP